MVCRYSERPMRAFEGRKKGTRIPITRATIPRLSDGCTPDTNAGRLHGTRTRTTRR